VDKDGETKDRSAVFDRYGKATKIQLGSADSKNRKIVGASSMHRLCATEVGQNKRVISAVADTRKVTIVSANQSMVGTYQKKSIG
jgi:RAB protein geranylgeranyltransferase component A